MTTIRLFVPNFGRPALLGLGLDKSFGTRIRLRSLPPGSTKLSYKPFSFMAVRHWSSLELHGVAQGISHPSCVSNGKDAQAAAGSAEWVDISKVRGCLEGMRDEDHSEVCSDPPADNRGVCCNPSNSSGMQTGWATEGGSSAPLVVGTAYGFGRPRCTIIFPLLHGGGVCLMGAR